MQRHITSCEVPWKLGCDYGQNSELKRSHFLARRKTKLLYAPIDNHRSIGAIERTIKKLKRRLGVVRLDGNNNPFKLHRTTKKTKSTITKIKINLSGTCYETKSSGPSKLHRIFTRGIKYGCIKISCRGQIVTIPNFNGPQKCNRGFNQKNYAKIHFKYH